MKKAGLAKKKGVLARNVDAYELRMGKKEEKKEHGMSDQTSEDIALDHLSEDPKYYTHLKRMEAQVKKGGSKLAELKKGRAPTTIERLRVAVKEGRVKTNKGPRPKEKARQAAKQKEASSHIYGSKSVGVRGGKKSLTEEINMSKGFEQFFEDEATLAKSDDATTREPAVEEGVDEAEMNALDGLPEDVQKALDAGEITLEAIEIQCPHCEEIVKGHVVRGKDKKASKKGSTNKEVGNKEANEDGEEFSFTELSRPGKGVPATTPGYPSGIHKGIHIEMMSKSDSKIMPALSADRLRKSGMSAGVVWADSGIDTMVMRSASGDKDDEGK